MILKCLVLVNYIPTLACVCVSLAFGQLLLPLSSLLLILNEVKIFVVDLCELFEGRVNRVNDDCIFALL